MKVRVTLALLIVAVVAVRSDAITTHPWSATVVGGPYDGEVGSGSFSYDETALVTGNETLEPTIGNLTIAFTILGQAFDETDDVDFNGYPELSFLNFVPVSMNYLLVEGGGSNPIEIDAPHVRSIDLIDGLTPVPGGGFHSFATVTVPEPATFAIAVPALLLLVARRRHT